MSPTGNDELIVQARTALLDALEALAAQRDALVLIGAQAIYLHTGDAPVALAEATKDSDLAVDPRVLLDDPLLEQAMQQAGFQRSTTDPQPGSWISPLGVPVDLMVPRALSGGGGRRGGRIPPHGKQATHIARGLEAAVVDHAPKLISPLDPADSREATVNVAGPASLLVSKLHKLGERQDAPGRLLDKDAHDAYRLLVATQTAPLAADFTRLLASELAGDVTREALDHLEQLFAPGPDALGSRMAGRAEEFVGAPAVTSAAAAALSADLLEQLRR